MTRLWLLFVLCSGAAAHAGPKLTFGEHGELEVYQAIQVWGVYTLGAEAARTDADGLEPVADRADLFVRRGRLGVKGKLAARHGFNVVLAYDGLGKGAHSGIRGGSNPDNLLIHVWDATWTFALHEDLAHLTVGYFRPQVGRLSMTGAFATHTFEKSLLQTYQRAHLVGRSNGREFGVNVGGLWKAGVVGLHYNVGAFDATHSRLVGPFAERTSPLLAARVALSLGDPEHPRYSLSYATNTFGRRTGVTLAAQGTWQGRTEVFEQNDSVGFDLLGHFAGLTVMGEVHLLGNVRRGEARTVKQVWFASAGYSFPLPNGYALEPFATITRFDGEPRAPGYTGTDRQLELGLNWYVDGNNMRVNAAYGRGDGTATSEYTDGVRFVRGDYVGLGLQYLY